MFKRKDPLQWFYLEKSFKRVYFQEGIMQSASFFVAPAIRKEEELKRREEEDFQVCTCEVTKTVCRLILSSWYCAFQKAVEESKKELEKEERRRRHQRREQQAEVVQQQQLFSEIEQHMEDITDNSAASCEVGYTCNKSVPMHFDVIVYYLQHDRHLQKMKVALWRIHNWSHYHLMQGQKPRMSYHVCPLAMIPPHPQHAVQETLLPWRQ